MDTEENYQVFKVILTGDTQVGKSHILSKFVKDKLPTNAVPTIGVEFSSKTISCKNGQMVKLQLWDTAGQERYRAIASAHFRRALGALVVFDLTKPLTFENIPKWIQEIRASAPPEVVIVLVGNKLDLVQKDAQKRSIDIDVAKNFAKENKIQYFETSTFTGESIHELFEGLLEEICKKMETEIKQ